MVLRKSVTVLNCYHSPIYPPLRANFPSLEAVHPVESAAWASWLNMLPTSQCTISTQDTHCAGHHAGHLCQPFLQRRRPLLLPRPHPRIFTLGGVRVLEVHLFVSGA